MFIDNKNGVSVRLIADTRLMNKDRLAPIRVQVTYKRQTKYYNTGKKVTAEDWAKLPNSRVPEMVKIKNSVKNSFEIIMECVENIFYQDFSLLVLSIFV